MSTTQDTYDAELARFRTVVAEYHTACTAYRAREIDDAAFLTVRRRLDDAQARLETAERQLQDETPAAPAPYTQCESCGGAYPPTEAESSRDGACSYCGRKLPDGDTE